MQLARLAEDYEKIKQAGADLVAISADNENFAWSTALTTGAKYQLLADPKIAAIKAYDIVNPHGNSPIAHPATFIIGKDGLIKYIYIGKDPTDRPADEVLLEEIKKVAAK